MSISIEEIREELKAMLAERSYQKRDVVLASGRRSNFYFDSKQTVLDGAGALYTGLAFFEALTRLEEFDRLSAVGGLELGSVPIGTAIGIIGQSREKPLVNLIIRKQAKEYGTQAAIEGASLVPKGSTVVVVEDVITTGGSSLKAAKRLVEEGYEIKTIISLIDRQEGGREAIEAEGFKSISLFVKSDFHKD